MSQVILILAVAFLIAIFLTGFWVSRTGKPYSVPILTIHKLISIASLIVLGREFLRENPTTALGSLHWFWVGAAGFLFAATILTGGFSSMEKPMPDILVRAHHILPFLTAIAIIGYILFMM